MGGWTNGRRIDSQDRDGGHPAKAGRVDGQGIRGRYQGHFFANQIHPEDHYGPALARPYRYDYQSRKFKAYGAYGAYADYQKYLK